MAEKKIHLLPENVANQIAAGEVVERPASAVKELIENSLDAGATKIDIEFCGGGKSYISITDNGCGMIEEDALLCLQRHSTSKLSSAKDLNTISSFGFRGEAIASIASVSNFILQTKVKEDLEATKICVLNSKIKSIEKSALNTGTKIEISNLFSSVPARLKFLKTQDTEANHIIRICKLYAVSHPECSFSLKENSKLIFSSPKKSTLESRVQDIYGKQMANELVRLGGVDLGEMKISGLICKIGTGKATKQSIFAFINSRPVNCQSINYALCQAYEGFLAKNRYPSGFLFLEIDPRLVDVNVHPAKLEVRFSNEPIVRKFVSYAIRQTLEKFELAKPIFSKKLDDNMTLVSSEKIFDIGTNDTQKNISFARPEPSIIPFNSTLKKENTPLDNKASISKNLKTNSSIFTLDADNKKTFDNNKTPPLETSFEKENSEKQNKKNNFQTHNIEKNISSKNFIDDKKTIQNKQVEDVLEKENHWKFKGFLKKKFAIFEIEKGFCILNMKAAKSTIAYEKTLFAMDNDNNIAMQNLLLPINLHTDKVQSKMLKKANDLLEKSGFLIEEFGDNFFIVKAVPQFFDADEKFFYELFEKEDLAKADKIDISSLKNSLAKKISSKVSENMPKTEKEVFCLIKDLLNCQNPNVAPNLEKTIKNFSNLDSLFKI